MKASITIPNDNEEAGGHLTLAMDTEAHDGSVVTVECYGRTLIEVDFVKLRSAVQALDEMFKAYGGGR